jgi:hypothetical protein
MADQRDPRSSKVLPKPSPSTHLGNSEPDVDPPPPEPVKKGYGVKL